MASFLGFLQRGFPKTRIIRMAVGLVGLFAAFGILIYLGQSGYYNFHYAEDFVPALVLGLTLTARSVAIVIPLGFTLGFSFGWARTTQSRLLRGLGAVYVEFFRSMPPLALIFFSYLISLLVVQQLSHDPFVSQAVALSMGTIALAFHSGGYQAEIIRAGILSVPSGQLEAADAVGLTRWQSMFRVVLPQAFRVSLPALGNEFSSVIKDTSLLSVIGLVELAQTGILYSRNAVQLDFNLVFIIWVEIALMYFLLTYIVTTIVRGIENHYKVPGLEAAEL